MAFGYCQLDNLLAKEGCPMKHSQRALPALFAVVATKALNPLNMHSHVDPILPGLTPYATTRLPHP